MLHNKIISVIFEEQKQYSIKLTKHARLYFRSLGYKEIGAGGKGGPVRENPGDAHSDLLMRWDSVTDGTLDMRVSIHNPKITIRILDHPLLVKEVNQFRVYLAENDIHEPLKIIFKGNNEPKKPKGFLPSGGVSAVDIMRKEAQQAILELSPFFAKMTLSDMEAFISAKDTQQLVSTYMQKNLGTSPDTIPLSISGRTFVFHEAVEAWLINKAQQDADHDGLTDYLFTPAHNVAIDLEKRYLTSQGYDSDSVIFLRDMIDKLASGREGIHTIPKNVAQLEKAYTEVYGPLIQTVGPLLVSKSSSANWERSLRRETLYSLLSNKTRQEPAIIKYCLEWSMKQSSTQSKLTEQLQTLETNISKVKMLKYQSTVDEGIYFIKISTPEAEEIWIDRDGERYYPYVETSGHTQNTKKLLMEK